MSIKRKFLGLTLALISWQVSANDYPLSPVVSFHGPQSAEIGTPLTGNWATAWDVVRAEALRIAQLPSDDIRALAERETFDPGQLPDFHFETQSTLLQNGEQIIEVIGMPNAPLDGIEKIIASFKLLADSTVMVQPLPVWSGPNPEGLYSWTHGYQPN